jgi:8-oxo-dGTP pyrophosphatase MutT (NUDIX family)
VSNGLNYKPYGDKDPEKNNSDIVVAVPARLTKIKGLEYLIDSLPLLKPNIKIHVCSPAGRQVEEEKSFKDSLLLKIKTDNIYFHEFDNDQWLSFLSGADMVLIPSLIEGQSLSLLEAMSQGKIVIATNVGGNPEIISNGENGFIIEPKSPKAISESIEYAGNLDDSIRTKLKNNAIRTATENFSFSKMIKNYLSLYEKAILKKQKNPKDVQPVIINNLQNPQFLILKRLNKNTNTHEFRLVKGGIKKMEEPDTALAREISEETGVQQINIIKTLTPYSYSYFLKRVYVTHNVTTYLVQAESKENFNLIDQAEEGGFDIDSVLWVDKENIITTLTYPQEKELVREAVEYLGK